MVKYFDLGNTRVGVDAEWFNNDGEKWTFDISIFDDNDVVRAADFKNDNPQISLVDTAIKAINRNKEWESSTKPLIEGAAYAEKQAIIEFIQALSNKCPNGSASESYYGV